MISAARLQELIAVLEKEAAVADLNGRADAYPEICRETVEALRELEQWRSGVHPQSGEWVGTFGGDGAVQSAGERKREGRAMKAFVVTDNYGEGHACVRFAAHAVVARREGANELDQEFDGVSCRRAPEFDAFAQAGEVPNSVLVEHGWWFECMQCAQKICSEPENEDGEPIELRPIYDGSWTFCSQKCRDVLHAEKAAQKAASDAVSAAALAKWPGIEICHANGYERPARVWFKFPGGQGQCDWKQGETTLLVEQRDQEAWKTFEDSLLAMRERENRREGEQR